MKNGPYELIVPPSGYPGKRYRGRYAYEHRVNWWRKTGRNPDDVPNSVVHHYNETKRDNKPSNLELMSVPEHSSLHRRPVTMIEYTCENCSKQFLRMANGKSGHHRFCSRRCIGFFHGGGRRKRKDHKIIPGKAQQGARVLPVKQ